MEQQERDRAQKDAIHREANRVAMARKRKSESSLEKDIRLKKDRLSI
jgi:hypothetical protein